MRIPWLPTLRCGREPSWRVAVLAFRRSALHDSRVLMMSRIYRSLAAFWILLIYAAFTCLPTFAAEPPWTEVHVQHFSVITNAGEKRGREVGVRLEQMRAVFGSLLMRRRLNMPVPFTVIALTRDKYAKVVHAGQIGSTPPQGFLLPGEDQNYIVLNVSEGEPWRAIAHDFADVLLQGNYPPTQEWFDQGFAEYFSSIRLSDQRMELGGDPGLEGDSAKSPGEIVGRAAWLPLPELFTMVPDTARNREDRERFYAESWIVMHYLLNQQKLQEAGTYFDLVQNQKMPIDQAIAKAFGMSPAQFEQAVKDYFHSLAPAASRDGSAKAGA